MDKESLVAESTSAMCEDTPPLSSLDIPDNNDKCRICTAVVSARGVLDCCSHVFCFACIHSWSSISNLCPLCKLQFKFITFLPVAEAEETTDADTCQTFFDFFEKEREEHSDCNEEDAALSFPSYFIDEDAVVCLDGDGCQIRSGCNLEKELKDADTSVACDSCDCWYHSICVGYDSSNSCLGSWLCPRCVGAGALDLFGSNCTLKSNQVSSDWRSPSSDCHANEEGFCGISALTGNHIVEIADKGETALVVSMASKATDPSFTGLGDNLSLGCASNFSEVVTARGSKASSTTQKDTVVDSGSFSLCGVQDDGNTEKLPDAISNRSAVRFVPLAQPAHVKQKTEDVQFEEKLSYFDLSRQISKDTTIEVDSDDSKILNTKSLVVPSIQQFTEENHVATVSLPHISKSATEDELKELIQGPEPRTQGPLSEELVTESTAVKDRETGVRTRKIMHRRTEEDGLTSFIVGHIRQQLREAAGPGASKDLGKVDVTDDKFFAAFKAAMVKSSGAYKRDQVSTGRTTNSSKLLGKRHGGRENLRKKLYGGSGRRRQAWDRDWEISFWKERAAVAKKARKEAFEDSGRSLQFEREKFEKAIIDYKECQNDLDPIFSRIYPADTSLFPRHNVQSLAMQDNSSNCSGSLGPVKASLHIKPGASAVNSSTQQSDHSTNTIGRSLQTPKKDMAVNQVKVLEVKNMETSDIMVATPLSSLVDKAPQLNSDSSNSNSGSQNLKDVKRKWALEVLARKTGGINSVSMVQQNSGDQKSLSLLDRLPMHMRPVIEYDHHSKVPAAIRQIQLNRFVEHHLQKENIKKVEITHACEAAIAAAVIKEKRIYDKSNSKGVYVNLCVQVLSQLENPLKESTEGPLEQVSNMEQHGVVALDPKTDDIVMRALKATGLISDSPPGSPLSQNKNKDSLKADLEDSSVNVHSKFEFDFDSGALGNSLSNERPCLYQNVPTAPKVNTSLTTGNNKCQCCSSCHEQGAHCQELEAKDCENHTLQEMQGDAKACQIKEEPDNRGNSDACNDVQDTIVLKSDECLMHSVIVKEDRDNRGRQGLTICVDKDENEHDAEGETEGDLKSIMEEGRAGVADMVMERQASDSATCNATGAVSRELGIPMENMKSNLSVPHLQRIEEDGMLTADSLNIDFCKGSSTFSESSLKDSFDHKETLQAVVAKNAAWKQVEKYVKEHIRPLHRSGVVTVEQYQWAVAKTTSKVMQYHADADSADFLISEGDKVKKLAEQYLKCFKKRKCS